MCVLPAPPEPPDPPAWKASPVTFAPVSAEPSAGAVTVQPEPGLARVNHRGYLRCPAGCLADHDQGTTPGLAVCTRRVITAIVARRSQGAVGAGVATIHSCSYRQLPFAEASGFLDHTAIVEVLHIADDTDVVSTIAGTDRLRGKTRMVAFMTPCIPLARGYMPSEL
jgi:hypothetical protein